MAPDPVRDPAPDPRDDGPGLTPAALALACLIGAVIWALIVVGGVAAFRAWTAAAAFQTCRAACIEARLDP